MSSGHEHEVTAAVPELMVAIGNLRGVGKRGITRAADRLVTALGDARYTLRVGQELPAPR